MDVCCCVCVCARASLIAVVVVIVVAAQGSQTPQTDAVGEEDLSSSVHPHLRKTHRGNVGKGGERDRGKRRAREKDQ